MSKLRENSCLIVTLCKSPNFGAYLQAYAMQEILKDYGYKVSFLDVYDKGNNKKKYRFLFHGWKRRPLSIIFNIKKYFHFKEVETKFDFICRREASRFNVAFIGADEIWSVTNGTFNSAPEFFGLNLPVLKKFAYAPSCGNSGLDDFKGYRSFIEGIKSLNRVSVRDSETYEVATKAASRNDVDIVLDPTFLYDFSNDEVNYCVNERYLLVYTYGFTKDIISEVKNYAKRNNLKVVSVGNYHSWVDSNISCTPLEFLSVVKQAECVITDTFHGSIFAIKYRKNFISYGLKKKKVKYLLESLKLEGSLVEAGYLEKNDFIATDYSGIDLVLEPMIESSRSFIESCNLEAKS